jgi:hypothetical protein
MVVANNVRCARKARPMSRAGEYRSEWWQTASAKRKSGAQGISAIVELASWGHANARQPQTVDSRGRVAEIVLPDSSPRRRIERRPSSPRLRAFSLSQEQRKRLMVRERG